MPAFDGGAGQRTVPEVINHEDRLLGIIDLEKLVDAESLFNTAGLATDAPVPVEDDSGILPLAQIALVQDSFANVVPIADQAAALFYEKLFELDPSVRPLFKGDMVEQGKKLMAALGVVVSNLKQPEKIIDTIQEMGRRHGEYGVKDEHYDTVGEALLWTLEQGLGSAFTPETRAAWGAAYGIVADTMKSAG
jgi:hemoglobin-like flavoprotein